MSGNDRWLLPDGIEEVLPDEARRLERLRRAVLDLFDCWGYQQVMPPLMEYLEALLTGVGGELDIETFKVTDPLTGRLMGIRADMTPQAARIDAHYLKRSGPVRLCYVGPVLRSRPESLGGSREPLQLGAELFGHEGTASDAETLALMLATLQQLRIGKVHLDLGHVGIFRALVAEAKLDATQEQQLFETLQRKAQPDVNKLTSAWSLPDKLASAFAALVELNGDSAVLVEADKRLGKLSRAVKQALTELKAVADAVINMVDNAPAMNFDLAELSGYQYYTGVVYSAFVPGHGRSIAKGGRYDGIGAAFGRARPATGFGADLRQLARLAPLESNEVNGIMAPADNDPALRSRIADLRANGERVVVAFEGVVLSAEENRCNRCLQKQGGEWQVVEL